MKLRMDDKGQLGLTRDIFLLFFSRQLYMTLRSPGIVILFEVVDGSLTFF